MLLQVTASHQLRQKCGILDFILPNSELNFLYDIWWNIFLLLNEIYSALVQYLL